LNALGGDCYEEKFYLKFGLGQMGIICSSGILKLRVGLPVLLMGLLVTGCNIHNVPINYTPINIASPLIDPKKEVALYLPPVIDQRQNKDSKNLHVGLLGGAGVTHTSSPPSEIFHDALIKELNQLGIKNSSKESQGQGKIQVFLKVFQVETGLGSDNSLGPIADAKLLLELYQVEKTQPIWTVTLEGNGESDPVGGPASWRGIALNKALSKAISSLRHKPGFKDIMSKLAVPSPKYLADKKALAQIKAELIPLDSRFRVVVNSAVIRELPWASSSVVKGIGLGGIIQVIGKLPSGWFQVAKEGEPVGWMHEGSAVLDSTITPSPRKQAQVGKALTPQSGTGSGFFVSKMGHIITNAHVVKGCNQVTVGDNANKQMPAEVLNTDGSNDLALLKLSSLDMASAESKFLIQKRVMIISGVQVN